MLLVLLSVCDVPQIVCLLKFTVHFLLISFSVALQSYWHLSWDYGLLDIMATNEAIRG